MTAEAPQAPPSSTRTATVCSVCFVVLAAIPYAGVASDVIEDWSAGLTQEIPASLDPESSPSSLAVLVPASAVVGLCHSAEEEDELPHALLQDVVER